MGGGGRGGVPPSGTFSVTGVFEPFPYSAGTLSPSPGIWAARARKVDRAKSYNYVTRALANVREKNVRDQKVFKVDNLEPHTLLLQWSCSSYYIGAAEGAVGGEKNDQGGEFCLLLGDDGEAHTQPVVQVHAGH